MKTSRRDGGQVDAVKNIPGIFRETGHNLRKPQEEISRRLSGKRTRGGAVVYLFGSFEVVGLASNAAYQ